MGDIPPPDITVEVAYGTNKGNALNNYDKRDFEFKSPGVSVNPSSGKKITVKVNNEEYGECKFLEGNKVKYTIKNKNFKLEFTGFDPDRELKIDVR